MFFVLLAPLQELDTSRADNPAGMAVVGLSTLVFLIWLWWRVHSAVRGRVLDAAT